MSKSRWGDMWDMLRTVTGTEQALYHCYCCCGCDYHLQWPYGWENMGTFALCSRGLQPFDLEKAKWLLETSLRFNFFLRFCGRPAKSQVIKYDKRWIHFLPSEKGINSYPHWGVLFFIVKIFLTILKCAIYSFFLFKKNFFFFGVLLLYNVVLVSLLLLSHQVVSYSLGPHGL